MGKYRTTVVYESTLNKSDNPKIISTNTVYIDHEDSDCIRTFDQIIVELAEVEERLAIRLNLKSITDEYRKSLIELDRANQLVEDELVARWHELVASYNSQLKFEYQRYQELFSKRDERS